MNKAIRCLWTAALACAAAHALAQADKYPTKPVRMILPFTAGTQTDVLARLMGQKLTESLGKQFVVDNRSGAGGMIAMQTVANSVPDGYTLFFDSSAFSIRPHLYPKAAMNIAREFQAVSLVASSPHVVVVSSQLGDSGHVRQYGRALLAGYREADHSAIEDERQRLADRSEENRRTHGHCLCHRFRGAPERNAGILEPGFLHEHLAH